MAEHRAHIVWKRTSSAFTYDTYNRAYEVRFKDGGIVLPSSATPAFKGDADRADPEEAYVASLSGCHMLSLLAICARKKIVVEAYDDEAAGYLEKAADGKLWMSRVILRPSVRFAPETVVDEALLADLHHEAHEVCFIARSVKTDVSVEPRP